MKTEQFIIELMKLKPLYERRRKMQVFNAVMLATINTFPEEKREIMELAEIPANVTTSRYEPTPKVVMNPNPKVGRSKVVHDGCVGCGEKQQPNVQGPLDPPDEVQQAGNVDINDLSKSKTFRDIMAAFAGLPIPMKEFMKVHGISIGNSSKADTLAKRIFEYVHSEDNV